MTAPQDEWTEWFQHDGKGCPCVGRMVETVERDGDRDFWAWNDFTWDWDASFRIGDIMKFRIRKPRALLDLIQLIADLPAPVAPIKTDGVIA